MHPDDYSVIRGLVSEQSVCAVRFRVNAPFPIWDFQPFGSFRWESGIKATSGFSGPIINCWPFKGPSISQMGMGLTGLSKTYEPFNF